MLGPFRILPFELSPREAYAESDLRMTFFDVGEGDAALIENFGPRCADRILVDSGNFMSGPQLSQKLLSRTEKNLDLLILTHPHPDHIGGVFSLLTQHAIRAIGDNGQNFSEAELKEGINRWYVASVRKSAQYRELRAPDNISLNCGGSLKVLWPPKGPLSSDWNNNSLILLYTRGKFRALLMGDALRETELELLKGEFLQEPLTVLKAGHHGSKHTASPEFVRAARPKYTVVSVGSPNPYGYPSPSSLENYKAWGMVLRTDNEGTISIEAGEDGAVSIARERDGLK